MLKETVSQARHTQNAADLAKLNTLISTFSPERQRALRRATSGTSHLLHLKGIILTCLHINLRMVLQYAINMRHPADLPACCDGCGADFTKQHGMDCKKGGLVIQRHNEVRDCLGDISSDQKQLVLSE